jgi:hemerythrin
MKFHFAVEEALLEIVGYPVRADHGAAHAKLIDQIAELEKQLQNNSTGENLVRFFENWFLGHVLSSDREFAAYLKQEFPALFGRRPA